MRIVGPPNILGVLKRACFCLALKTIMLPLRIGPCSIRLLQFYTFCATPLLALRRIGQWRSINTCRRLTGQKAHPLIFLVRYFFQRAKMLLWSFALPEAFPIFRRYSDFEDIENLRETLGDRGCIFLSLHHGPHLFLWALAVHDHRVNALVDDLIISDAKVYRHIPRIFLPLRYAFLGATEDMLTAHKSEKSLVEAVRRHESALMMNDYPIKTASKTTARLFDMDLPASTFPFRLSLRYNVPVMFFHAQSSPKGGYAFKIDRLHFETVDEGLQRYFDRVQETLMREPMLIRSPTLVTDWMRQYRRC
jgi:hypothetical protein